MEHDMHGCEDAPQEQRLAMIKSAIMTGRIGKDVLLRAEEKDGWWAGVIRCVSVAESKCPHGRDSCAIFKSAYIFETEKDASAWIKETLGDIKKTIGPQDLMRLLAMVAQAEHELAKREKEGSTPS